MKRRDFLKAPLGALALQACGPRTNLHQLFSPKSEWVNDVHSRLNLTRVNSVQTPGSVDELCRIVRESAKHGREVSISGGRHAMGGQQFATDSTHLSLRGLNRVLGFDRTRGILNVEAGICWPDILDYTVSKQIESNWAWGIVQKQTGADELSIGGALAANAHGRGVGLKPFVQDVEAFTLVTASGERVHVSRNENPELFSLVIGGYGLFGVVSQVSLRLQRRYKIERVVEVLPIEALPEKVRDRIAAGFTYGDFQYKTDSSAKDFMRVGVFSCYRPISETKPIEVEHRQLSDSDWNSLLYLAHTDKGAAFDRYANYYLTTTGQRYWSDTHQLSYYNKNYVEYLSSVNPKFKTQSLMITEIYVPRESLLEFTQKLANEAQREAFDIVYGTMRLIEQDDETFLPWAKQDYACIIFNLAVEHNDEGIARAKRHFQLLIDRALEYGGSYFLTYHRWARKDQVLAAYPKLPDFLALKQKYDPDGVFQSDWFRHYQSMFA
jgi:FAD/FMN-containing dehydrogenase